MSNVNNQNRNGRGANKNNISFEETTERYEAMIKDIHWLVFFTSDGTHMNIPANYGGVNADLYMRAHAKVNNLTLFTLTNLDSISNTADVNLMFSMFSDEHLDQRCRFHY